ncbi:MAG TPA: GlsB/YeaQ/YmgE family stress response membrane protein, partial [Planctomycetaceae bacterium]|nr:GlsB/YeaQ/YmgE family stress response membrane protein [Planctomycetaceae bacterium]
VILRRSQQMEFSGNYPSLAWTLIAGLIAGWIVGEMRKGEGFGLFGNLLVGVLGAIVGGLIFHGLHFDKVVSRLFPLELPTMVQPVVYAFVGAMLLLFILDRIGLKT